jgi:hypothetical protein
LTVHDANAGTLGQFGGWHWWCSCGEGATCGDREKAEFAVYYHLRPIDPERARRYAQEKGLNKQPTVFIRDCPGYNESS